MDNQSYTPLPFIKLHESIIMLTLNSTKFYKAEKKFSVLENFSNKLTKWNLRDKPRTTEKVQLSKITQIIDS